MKNNLLKRSLLSASIFALSAAAMATTNPSKPNVLAIWGDDIGMDNLSAYTMGQAGHWTPNIDRIAKEGAIFTDYYGENSCTAGRAAFITGQHPHAYRSDQSGYAGCQRRYARARCDLGRSVERQGLYDGPVR
ncbi:sulfatase-like hydrolase/transferase [Candidatus Pelagadaptatus aseana]|uniref:sulfatase-like hydrolase/transferase n=1 Tax=Candidatus Pelagadaptatus aseana TaxID=3120508 RepID=UPI003C6F5CEE